MSGIGPMLVAVDDGYDTTKACTRERSDRFPTAVTAARKRTARLLGSDRMDDVSYLIGDQEFTVGADVQDPLDTRSNQYPYSPASLAVAMEAIRRVAPAPVKVHAITGLPLNRFYDSNGNIHGDNVDRKTANWYQPVKTAQDVPLPKIAEVTVIAQAVAAWFDFVIDEAMQEKHDVINDHMAVVDIGGRTTDLAVFRMSELDMRTSGTLDFGMLNVADEVARFIEDKHPGVPLQKDMLVKAMRQRIVQVGPDSYDVGVHIERGKQRVADRLQEFVSRRLGGDSHLVRRILFVGGGSTELKAEILRRFPSACFPAGDPQMANARGMLKYGHVVREAQRSATAA